MEINPLVLEGYARAFISRFDRYAIQKPEGDYGAVKHPLTLHHVEQHFRGEITLGAYALTPQNHAHWICFDADDDDMFTHVQELAKELANQAIPAYIEPSRRGGHVWLFTPPLSGTDARRFGKQLLAEHHIEHMELYPKQSSLITGPGSFVRLPLGIHRKSGRRYHFVTFTGEPLAPTIREQIAILATPERVPQTFIDHILSSAPEAKPVFPTPRFQRKNVITGDTPSERIKNRVSVYDFVSQYVELDQSGRGLCPFHDDHVQSFSVNQQDNYWNCFAECGKPSGGSVIDFWMRWRETHGESADFKLTIVELIGLLNL
ncbi:MAG: hypothetical protein K8L97_20600 [Anaerolineae bacterium]|nr:hypothetical protein [Anaerolineae bacterium]